MVEGNRENMKTEKIKVLHFLTSANLGGAERFCIDLCNTQVQKAEIDVNLCVLDAFHEDIPLLKQVSEKVNVVSMRKNSGYELLLIKRIYKFLKELKPDVIQINGRAIIYTSLPILLTKIPSLYTVHTLANKEYNKYFTAYNRFLFSKFHKLFMPVAIGPSVSKTIQEVYGEQFKELVYNGISPLSTSEKKDDVHSYIESMKQNKETQVFLYVGRIAPEKNTYLLVETFNKLLKEGQNVLLLIIGYDSTLQQDYMIKCKKLNENPEKIKFLGRKENIADYLSCTDALCVTSLYEGLSIVSLEAFSMGVPVLSTPAGGMLDIIIKGVNGNICDKMELDSYSHMILKFIKNPIKNKKEIIKIYKDNYTMKSCSEKYIALYKKRIHGVKK